MTHLEREMRQRAKKVADRLGYKDKDLIEALYQAERYGRVNYPSKWATKKADKELGLAGCGDAYPYAIAGRAANGFDIEDSLNQPFKFPPKP